MSENVKMQRGYISLEDGDFTKALNYFDAALNENPYDAGAYWGMMLCDMFCIDDTELLALGIDFTDNANYEKAVRFAGEEKESEYRQLADSTIKNGQMKIIELLSQGKYAIANLRVENLGKNELTFPEAATKLYKLTNNFTDLDVDSKKLLKILADLENAHDYKEMFLQNASCRDIYKRIEIYRSEVADFQEKKRLQQEKDRQQREILTRIKNEERRLREEEQRQKQDEQNKKERIKRKRVKTLKSIITVVVLALIVFGILLFTVIIPSNKYSEAKMLMDNGMYQDALEIFKDLSFKDSAELADKCEILIADLEFAPQYEALKNATIGDTVVYGYASNKNWTSVNGNDEIEWIVMEIKDGKMLLITKNALYEDSFDWYAGDYDNNKREFNPENVSWNKSTIRNYLNEIIFNEIFIGKAAEFICDAETSQGVLDKLFFFNYEETQKYFGIDKTGKIKNQEIGVLKDGKGYWIRTTENDEDFQCVIYADGSIGSPDAKQKNGVRPAMWVDISK